MLWRNAGWLVLTATVAATVGAAAAEAPGFLAFSWSAVPGDCGHITPLLWVKADSKPDVVAAESLQRPAGRRAIFSWDMHRGILDQPADCCRGADGQLTPHPGVWPEAGVAQVRDRFATFFTAFKAAGGQMDWFVLDFEGGYSNWHVGSSNARERWLAIQCDPRFGELAKVLGFEDLLSVCDWSKGGGRYLVWNAVMAGRTHTALNQAIFEPLRTLYPGLQGSNYGSVVMTRENAVPDLNGHLQWSAGPAMGTHQAPSLYTWIGQLGDRALDGRQPFGRSPFAGLLLTVKTVRALQRSSAVPITPWVAWQRYAGDGPTSPPATCANTPYYREMVLHLGLSGCTNFLFWNPHPWRQDQAPDSLSTDRDERLLESILTEMEQRLPGAARTPLTTQALPWDSRLIASALRLGDRVVWRLTVAPGVKTVQANQAGKPIRLAIPDNEPGVWYELPAAQALTDIVVAE